MTSEDPADDRKVILDIGGKLFVTLRSTLQRIPESKLGRLAPDDPSYDRETKHYFFDRNPKLFGQILDLYRTGHLHFPHCACGPFIKQELAFWELDEGYIADCCWRAYSNYEHDLEKLKTVEQALYRHSLRLKADTALQEAKERGEGPPKGMRGGTWPRVKQAVWFFLEDPTSSFGARIWALMFLVVIVLSVAVQCMITHPEFRFDLEVPRRNISSETNPKILLFVTTELMPVVWYIDFICFVILALEIIVRIMVCPKRLEFFKSVYNVVDLLCIIPMTMLIVIEYTYPNFWTYSGVFNLVFFLTFLGFFRILRLIKFARHYQAMSILLLSLRASLKELFLLIMLIGIGMLIFSYLIYFAEFNNETDFDNIPVGFWWAIVTMTTVGYGDKKPVTEWGYVVGAMCALTGMLSTGLPIPIIASNFNMYYTYAKRSILLRNRPKKKPPLLFTGPEKPATENSPVADGKAGKVLKQSEIHEVSEIHGAISLAEVEQIITSDRKRRNGRAKSAWMENYKDCEHGGYERDTETHNDTKHKTSTQCRHNEPNVLKKKASSIDGQASSNSGFEPDG